MGRKKGTSITTMICLVLFLICMALIGLLWACPENPDYEDTFVCRQYYEWDEWLTGIAEPLNNYTIPSLSNMTMPNITGITFPTTSTTLKRINDSQIMVTVSEMMGDYVQDTRIPEEVCGPKAKDVTERYNMRGCSLVESSAVSSGHPAVMEKCVDGHSIAGCFSCTFKCERKDYVSIASWDLHVFNEAKAGNINLMTYYVEKMREHDIIVIQGINDPSGNAFQTLCTLMRPYKCVNSSSSGQPAEQYGVLYDENVELVGFTDHNLGGHAENFKNPPVTATFTAGNWTFQLTTLHADPENVREELKNLETLTLLDSSRLDEIIIGDLKADCGYYDIPPAEFRDMLWVIPDTEDTSVDSADCAYDRIILNNGAEGHYLDYDVMRDVNVVQGNNYMISVEFKTGV
ncbi:MAG: hypothetical protein ABIH11_03860 [Candidatus Altiarchaeota archaeon]